MNALMLFNCVDQVCKLLLEDFDSMHPLQRLTHLQLLPAALHCYCTERWGLSHRNTVRKQRSAGCLIFPARWLEGDTTCALHCKEAAEYCSFWILHLKYFPSKSHQLRYILLCVIHKLYIRISYILRAHVQYSHLQQAQLGDMDKSGVYSFNLFICYSLCAISFFFYSLGLLYCFLFIKSEVEEVFISFTSSESRLLHFQNS